MTTISSRFVAAALAIPLAVGSVSTAQARDNWVGPAAAGVVGGLIIGGAIANSRPAYAYPPPTYSYPPPSYGYVPPAYAAPPPVVYTPPTVYTAPPSVAYVSRSPHTDWCYANRPGYNAYDNTFQPVYGGAREYCQSPYQY